MTYKSIGTYLNFQVERGGLGVWEPSISGISCKRDLFFTREVRDAFNNEAWSDHGKAYRFGLLRQDFDAYVGGSEITFGLEPKGKDPRSFMARVEPVEYGIVDIRSRSPNPQVRVFGAFAMTDCFVALDVRLREELHSKEKWAAARENALSIWQRVMNGFEPKVGGSVNDYVSESATSV